MAKRTHDDASLAEPAKEENKKAKKHEDYWYWIDDRHSYTKEVIEHYVKTLNLPSVGLFNLGDSVHSLSGKRIQPLNLYDLVSPFSLQKCSSFRLDRSRSTGDLVCSLCWEPWAQCDPHLLNLNGRSYDRDALVTAIEETLQRGEPLRLEDLTIEPEQIQSVVLYPNQSLGSTKTEAISYQHAKPPIAAFDERIRLEDKPLFWEQVAILKNELWNLDDAAFAFGFSSPTAPSPIVIANQLCVNRKVPWPHPKVVTKDSVVFRNCLFRRCDIDISCWCGPHFHGCLFEDCTFLFATSRHYCEEKAKQCSIRGGRVVHIRENEKEQLLPETWMKAWLKKFLGQAEFEMEDDDDDDQSDSSSEDDSDEDPGSYSSDDYDDSGSNFSVSDEDKDSDSDS